MKSSRARLYNRLSLAHRNQWVTLELREAQEKARLYTDYRPMYARLMTETQRARLLQQFTREFQRLNDVQQRRRNRLAKQQRKEHTHVANTNGSPMIFA